MPVNKIKVSVSDLSKRALVAITQGDSRSRIIEATVMDGGSPLDLTGKKARFRAELPHGKVVIDDGCEVADPESGAVVYTLSDEMAASPAVITNAYFEIYDDAGYSLAASKMVIEVGGGVDLGGARPSDYVPELDRLKAEARDAIVACEDAAAKANATASQAARDAQVAIAEVKATEAKLYPVAENILVRSETGAVAHVEDAFAGASLRKITVEGAFKQDGIPSPDAPKPITVVENPAVKMTGRNLFDVSKINVNTSAPYGLSISVEDDCIIVQGTASGIDDGNLSPSFVLGWYADNSLSGKGLSIRIFGAPSSVRAYGLRTADETQIAIVTALRNGEKVNWTSQIAVSKGESQEYKPYTSQTLTFALPAEHPYLAKLPDGTADEIVVDRDGNVELVARVAKVTPKDSDRLDFGAGTDTVVPYVSFPISGITNKMGILCNSYQTSYWINKSGYIYCPNGLDIAIRDSRFTSKEKAIELLDGVVVYIAVEPIRYPLGKIEMPKAQDSIVNAWTDAEITPNTGIGYVRDVNIVVSHLESAIASITEG